MSAKQKLFPCIFCVVEYWGAQRKGKEGMKAHPNVSLEISGPSIVNRE